MNYMQALAILRTLPEGPPLRFLLAMSGGFEKLDVFLRAEGARRDRPVLVRTLPFNTLAQWLLSDAPASEPEVFLLFPWDLVPEADWRSGLPVSVPEIGALETGARATASRLARRGHGRLLYVSAPLPPLFSDPRATVRLEAFLSQLAASVGADLLPGGVFSLSSYLSLGCPVASAYLGLVAERVIGYVTGLPTAPAKVLVTDLDNVMWRGVIGEDGLSGIHFRAEGAGFRHFIYQTFLAKLKRDGALLAAVSRNDAELARAPFGNGRMALRSDDFVAIVASYNAKSAQIKEIARRLDLGLDSFVFVDDNPIEIEEVTSSVPGIRALQFPPHDDSLPAFLGEVAALFGRSVVTAEDAARTELYRVRLEGMQPEEGEGADLAGFLRGLKMSLTIHDRSVGDRVRAVQLINKTNQFNLNGRRVSDDEVGFMLHSGGRLLTCTLADRTGSHGEILACLIDPAGTVRSLVMSCRVFQRRVEHAFFAWLGSLEKAPRALEFVATPRNEPMRKFLEHTAFSVGGAGETRADLPSFARAHEGDLALFVIGDGSPSRRHGE